MGIVMIGGIAIVLVVGMLAGIGLLTSYLTRQRNDPGPEEEQ